MPLHFPRRRPTPRITTDVAHNILNAILPKLRNEQRMRDCQLLWATSTATIGICPGFDDFLIWLEMDKHPAYSISATPDVIAYYQQQVRPVLRRHEEADSALRSDIHERRQDWVLQSVDLVMKGEINIDDPLPEHPEEDRKLIEELQKAHRQAVETLWTFVRQFNAKHEGTE